MERWRRSMRSDQPRRFAHRPRTVQRTRHRRTPCSTSRSTTGPSPCGSRSCRAAHGQTATRLVGGCGAPPGARFPLVVADRIAADRADHPHRRQLVVARPPWPASFYRPAPGVRVDQPVPADHACAGLDRWARHQRALRHHHRLLAERPSGAEPVTQPRRCRSGPRSVDHLHHGAAPRRGGSVERRVCVAPDLFWELAAVWRSERTWLVRRPDPKQHVPTDSLAPSWRMTGTTAAAAYGAPLTSAGEGPLDLYVIGPVELSIAVRR